jgi:hypothetical protein
MSSLMLAIQYLEDSPAQRQLDRKQVIDKLHTAAGYLPFTHLLIGWNVSPYILEACRAEADRLGMRFVRWQPLLTSDKGFTPNPSWQVMGLSGNKLVGYHGMPEFTFACPNNPAMQEAVTRHIGNLVHQGLYQGFFLDRIRFPSPSADPINDLSCFCEYCQHKAAQCGLDLDRIKLDLLSSTHDEKNCLSLVKSLLTGKADPERTEQSPSIGQFLEFRKRSIADFLARVTYAFGDAQLEISLDCFSPSLTHMVGQDLGMMSKYASWVKVMTYAHAMGPAGLPFELSCFLGYLTRSTNLSQEQSLSLLSQYMELPLPNNRASLLQDGLSSLALEREVERGIESCSAPLLAGLELVELEGVTHLVPSQIRDDLYAVKRAKPAGLAISWDLLHIPIDRIELVRRFYLE